MPQDFSTGQVLTAAQMDTLSAAVDGYTTTATAAGTTTLTTASMFQQFFTGSTTQTVLLPVASTLYTGRDFRVVNNSSGVVTVQSSGANTIYAVPAGGDVIFTCILASGTTAASWDYKNYIAAASTPALVKITTATFSGVATTSTSFDGIFTSTYKKYLVVISNATAASSSAVLYLQTRVAAVTKTTNYYSGFTAMNYAGTKLDSLSNNASQFSICRLSDTVGSLINMTFTGVGNASEYPILASQGSSGYENGYTIGGGAALLNQNADGIILSASTGNISGTVTVYGLAN